MRYPDSVEYLYSLGNEIKTIKFGLEAIRAVLEALDNPHEGPCAVHVAGTNGKGSTCAMIESGLRAAGHRTGLYTSPHLVEPTERIQIAGRPVTREQFADAFHRVHAVNEALMARGALEHHTTYFETVTAMAFLLFRDAGVTHTVIETGLGGRLDATNVLGPGMKVITPVDFDHEAWLGSTLEAIAAEKAGIIKPDSTVVLARQRPGAEEVLLSAARHSRLIRTADYAVSDLIVTAQGSEFVARRNNRPLHIRCPLPGEHQVENALCATAVLDSLIDAGSLERGIAAASWPGRLERIHEAPDIILDGAHNPAGARALAGHIQRVYSDRPVALVYGAMRDKSLQEITEILFPLAREVVLTRPSSPRSARPSTLESATDHASVLVIESPAQALAWARSLPPDHVVFITGSLYLVGDIRALLQ